MSNFSNYNERESLDAIYKIIGQSNSNLLGNDEDAVCIEIGNGFLVINIDGWVESSDKPSQMDFKMAGYRAMVNSASDIIAKGLKPQAIVASISTSNSEIALEIVKGLKHACEDYAVEYLGGDLNESKDTVVDVTTIGYSTKSPLLRSGAKVNDLVCWLGPEFGIIGHSLKVLLGDRKGNIDESLKNYGYPKLYTGFLKIEEITSAMDCSDGLAFTLHKIAYKSKKKITLKEFKHNYSWIHDHVSGKDIYNSVFFGGEELGVVFTCSKETKLPPSVVIMGLVGEGEGVYLNDELIENKGWEHFTFNQS